MGNRDERILKRWVLAAPLIFSLHFLEEAPGFVDWVNTYVDQGITQQFFLGANFLVLVVTSVVALMMAFSPSSLSASVLILWLGFTMLANGILHVVAGILEQRYVPGLITAALMYIPYYILLVNQLVIRRYTTIGSAIFLTLIGAVPMATQGYRVYFLGSRLW